MGNLEQHIVEFGYTQFPLATLVLIGFILRLIWQNNLSKQSFYTLIAFLFIGIASGVRVGWFALSRLIGPGSDVDVGGCAFMVHNAAMWELKWMMALQTGLMYTAGVMLFIHIFDPYTKLRFFGTIAFIFGFSLLSAII